MYEYRAKHKKPAPDCISGIIVTKLFLLNTMIKKVMHYRIYVCSSLYNI